MADFDTIKQEINVNIPDNNSQYITAKKVRDTLLDMIDDVDEAKQDALVSGTNIKTINGYTLLGSGDIVIEGGGDLSAYVSKEELSQMGYVTSNYLSQASYVTNEYLSQAGYVTNEYLSQASYVTQSDLNNMSYVTSSDLSNASYVTQSELSNMSYATTSQLSGKQDTLVSGTNIKTINNESLLGSGNIVIEGGGDLSAYVSKVELSNMGYITMGDVSACGYITTSDVSQMGYVTSSALSNMSYATTTDLNNAIGAIDIPTYTSDLTNDSGFITASDLSGYATETYVADYVSQHAPTPDLSAYVSKDELSSMGYITMGDVSTCGYITVSDVSQMGYITTSDLPDMSSYATLSYLESYYATLQEVWDGTDAMQQIFIDANILVGDPETGDLVVQTMASETYVAEYVAQHAPTPDLSAYVSKVELSNAGYITSIPSEYVTESELSAKGYITSIPAEYVTQSQLSANSYVTQSELSQAGYLTVVPSEYITETEITGMGYVTATELSNASYVTESQLQQAGYATSTDLVSYLNIANFNRTVPVQLRTVGLTTITTNVPNTIAPQQLTYSQFTALTNPWVGGATMINYVNEVMPVIDESIIPNTTLTYTLGDSSHFYNTTYASELYVNGNSKVYNENGGVGIKIGNNSAFRFGTTAFYSVNTNTKTLGSNSSQWSYTYSYNFIENGTDIKDIYTQTEVVTQAQYDELTTEQKNSETIYVISDQQAYFDNELVTEQSLAAKGFLTADNFQYDPVTGVLTLIL